MQTISRGCPVPRADVDHTRNEPREPVTTGLLVTGKTFTTHVIELFKKTIFQVRNYETKVTGVIRVSKTESRGEVSPAVVSRVLMPLSVCGTWTRLPHDLVAGCVPVSCVAMRVSLVACFMLQEASKVSFSL